MPQLEEAEYVPPPPLDEPPYDNVADEQASLFDDVEALVDDARTYFDAEVSYQKTRFAFVASCLKKGIAFIAIAAFVATLATIGLTVGLIIALTPLITAWGATAVVVLVYLLLAYVLIRQAIGAFRNMASAIREDEEH